MAKEFSAKAKGKGVDVQEIANDEHVIQHIPLRKRSISVDISFRTVLMILLVGATIYFGSKLLDVIVLLFLAFIISASALPSVRWLMNKGVSKGASITLVYLAGTFFLALLVMAVFVPVISETQKLLSDIPGFIIKFEDTLKQFNAFGFEINREMLSNVSDDVVTWITENVSSQFGVDSVRTALGTVVGLAGGVVQLITAFLMSIYIVFDHDNFVDEIMLRIFDSKKRNRVRQLILDVEEKLGSWLLGQASLSLIIGLMSWILLTVLDVPFALPLAVLAGLLEAIPNLGPILASIPTILVALIAGSPVTAVFVALGYVLIQQLENTIIVPKVMAKAVGLKPIIIIVAVASGFTLAGPLGALLSVPVAVLLQIAYDFYLDLQKIEAEGIV
ncbi:MAG TPA: AI-2E family transporter [Candidatus Dojkabacteria bacterium]|nr:AI-2E family transporter [Candidatus Dojkabacteria bacterium]